MVLCFWLGHIYYTFLLIGFGFKTHFELMDLNRNDKHEARNPTFRIVEWMVPLLTAYYLTPRTFMRRVLVENEGLFDFHQDHLIVYPILFVHHTLICGIFLILLLVFFTLTLEKGQYRYQFKRLGWLVLTALTPISGSLFLGYYVYKGYFWLLITNGCVMINDVMAYVFGKTMGRTQLIALSPKKTVEGFLGGGLSTVIFAVFITDYLAQYPKVTCPETRITLVPFRELNCTRPAMFDK